jgi:hypothetical protein
VEPGSARARGRDATTGDQRVCHPEDPAAPELHRVRASCPARVPTRFVAAAADPPPPPASSRLMVAAGEPISALGICALLLERRGAPPAWAPRAQVSFCVQPTAGGRWKGSWYHGTKMNRMNSGWLLRKKQKKEPLIAELRGSGTAAAMPECGTCRKALAPPLLLCSRCKAVAYCCKECQVQPRPRAEREARAKRYARAPEAVRTDPSPPAPPPPCPSAAARPPHGRPGTSASAAGRGRRRGRRRCSAPRGGQEESARRRG